MNPLQVCLVALLLSAASTWRGSSQSVPMLINYQGRLANPDGSPFPTADYELSVRIWNASTNGSLVWGPQVFDGVAGAGHASRIPVIQGYFNVMLGPVDTNGVLLADAFTAANRFVEVTLSNRAPILPRQQILTTPYAFRAGDIADGVVSLPKLAAREIGTNVRIGGIAVSGNIPFASVTQDDPVPGASVALVTTGRPVLVLLVPADTGDEGQLRIFKPTQDGVNVYLGVLRNGEKIGGWHLLLTMPGVSGGSIGIPLGLQTLDLAPPAGTNTYSLRWRVQGNSTSATLTQARLAAFEL